MMQTIWKICFHKNIHEYSNLDITGLRWITFDNSEQLWDFVKGNRKFESENVFPNFIFGYINSNGKFLKKNIYQCIHKFCIHYWNYLFYESKNNTLYLRGKHRLWIDLISLVCCNINSLKITNNKNSKYFIPTALDNTVKFNYHFPPIPHE